MNKLPELHRFLAWVAMVFVPQSDAADAGWVELAVYGGKERIRAILPTSRIQFAFFNFGKQVSVITVKYPRHQILWMGEASESPPIPGPGDRLVGIHKNWGQVLDVLVKA